MSQLLVESRPRRHIDVTREREIAFELGPEITLRGDLAIPADAHVLIVVPHTSRLPRRLPYNEAMTTAMNRRRIGTLLIDCLTSGEKGNLIGSVGPDMLAERLVVVTQRLGMQRDIPPLPLGYLAPCGASAVALLAANQLPGLVGAVVSFGIPDEAEITSIEPTAPRLVIADGTAQDHEARRRLGSAVEFVAVPGCRTLGRGDPGPHKRAFASAGDWLVQHLHVEEPHEPARRMPGLDATYGRSHTHASAHAPFAA